MKKRIPLLILMIFVVASLLSSCLLVDDDSWFYYGIDKLGKATAEPTSTESATEEPSSTTAPDEQRDIPDIKKSEDGEELTVSEIYKKTVNSVVGITTKGTTKNIWGQTTTSASTGTGIILSTDGYILTNNHVIESGDSFMVTLYNGKSYDATLVGAEPSNDVAVLKIDATNLSAATFGDSSNIIVGEDVIVIGNPLGELTYTLTRGVVSALNRLINEDGIPINMFQVDAAVNSGNSGGPAFDARGHVIGMVTAKPASSEVDGIGFCIPINDALKIAEELIKYGYVTGKGALGVCATEAYTRTMWGTQLVSGAYISDVLSGSAAEKAGMKVGMLITLADGVEITSSSDLQIYIQTSSVGDKVHLSGQYNNETFELDVVLDEYTPNMVPTGYKGTGTVM